jgi:hypothetical protein
LQAALRLPIVASGRDPVFSVFCNFCFFSKKVAQVAIVGNKTEPKMTIKSDKTEKKIIHNNLFIDGEEKYPLQFINKFRGKKKESAKH